MEKLSPSTPADSTRIRVTRVLTLQGLRSTNLLHGFKVTTGIRGGYSRCNGICAVPPSVLGKP
jgi:hypothetical protein